MDQEVAVLRRKLGRVARGRGTRYPTELRERGGGVGARTAPCWGELAKDKGELGQKFDTIRQWCRGAELKGSVDDEYEAYPDRPCSRGCWRTTFQVAPEPRWSSSTSDSGVETNGLLCGKWQQTVGAAVVIGYFELTPAEQRKRLDQRLADAPHETWPMSEQELAQLASKFDIPTPTEPTGANPSANRLWFRDLARVDGASLAALGEWRRASGGATKKSKRLPTSECIRARARRWPSRWRRCAGCRCSAFSWRMPIRSRIALFSSSPRPGNSPFHPVSVPEPNITSKTPRRPAGAGTSASFAVLGNAAPDAAAEPETGIPVCDRSSSCIARALLPRIGSVQSIDCVAARHRRAARTSPRAHSRNRLLFV